MIYCYKKSSVANAYSRLVSTYAVNAVTYLRTTHNLVFASLNAYKTTMQHVKENTKQIFDINSNAVKTFEQNSREVTKATQDASSRFNASVNRGSGSSNTATSTSTSTSAA